MTDGEPTAPRGLRSRNTRHDLLADERRRIVLACLDEHGPLVRRNLVGEFPTLDPDSGTGVG
jgi:hypothetical protein